MIPIVADEVYEYAVSISYFIFNEKRHHNKQTLAQTTFFLKKTNSSSVNEPSMNAISTLTVSVTYCF